MNWRRDDARRHHRLHREPQISSASTYTDRETAERVIAVALRADNRAFTAWRDRTGRRPNFAVRYRVPFLTFVQLNRDGINLEDTSAVSQSDRIISLIGVRDIVVIDTPDALLVTTTANAQRVKSVVDALKLSGRSEVL